MDWAAQREQLVDRLADRDRIDDQRVLDAIRAVPRHAFVPEGRRDAAHEGRPLPIGDGQTISAPHIVAIIDDLLDLTGDDRVLEIGTGCGYHAAVTAELVDEVYSVEYRTDLADGARDRLADLGYENVTVRTGDGREGWGEHAPYDRAYLTCAAESFPRPVVEQVRPGGLLVGPLGDYRQQLVRARRRADGQLDRDYHGGVRFVSME